jgi:hypothetical protein
MRNSTNAKVPPGLSVALTHPTAKQAHGQPRVPSSNKGFGYQVTKEQAISCNLRAITLMVPRLAARAPKAVPGPQQRRAVMPAS